MKKLWRFLIAAAGLFLVLLLAVFVWLWVLSPGTTPPFRDAEGRVKPGSIAALEKITLGGLPQWICVRGEDQSRPVLLVLHGGPGMPEMLLQRKYLADLEKHFVVVNWDQPGAGKSFNAALPPESMKPETFVNLTLELSAYLRQRFKQDKIYLLGHSWGSYLGMLAVQKHPEYYAAYIGVGQVVNMQAGERLSYQFALETAKQRKNKKALEELTALGEPPYAFQDDTGLKKVMTERKWIMQFGANVASETSFGFLLPILIHGQEYTLMDKVHFFSGAMLSLKQLWPQLMDADLFKQVPKVSAPVYFCEGRQDYTIPSSLAEQYYQQLEAPQKSWQWFENSAHNACYEEAEAFVQYLAREVLKDQTR